jgi:hypothetical protein
MGLFLKDAAPQGDFFVNLISQITGGLKAS